MTLFFLHSLVYVLCPGFYGTYHNNSLKNTLIVSCVCVVFFAIKQK